MKQTFNTLIQISEFIEQKYPRNRQSYKIILLELEKLTILSNLLKTGFNKDDIAFAIKRKIPLQHHYCPQCGNEIHVYKLNRYPKCCSVSCSVKYSQELRKKNSLAKYGVENPMQADVNKSKTKNTMLKRYGGYTLQSKELTLKVARTNLKRYGVKVAGANLNDPSYSSNRISEEN